MHICTVLHSVLHDRQVVIAHSNVKHRSPIVVGRGQRLRSSQIEPVKAGTQATLQIQRKKECLSSVKRHLHRVKPAERSSKAQMDDIVHESSFERLDDLRQSDRNVHTTAERRRAPCLF